MKRPAPIESLRVALSEARGEAAARGVPPDCHCPMWDRYDPVHNWRNYIPNEVVGIWDLLSEDARELAAFLANDFADREEWD